eukprot:GHVS01012665.1.p1 GENE.GHVS01012665.1~~GHVS01012665.1.p1  ORF type:complete len:442 (+),score=107.05 GHVS01012665.1:134-1459(+)
MEATGKSPDVVGSSSLLVPTVYGVGCLVHYRPCDRICEIRLKFGSAFIPRDGLTNIDETLRRFYGLEDPTANKKKSNQNGGSHDVGDGGGDGGGSGGGGCLVKSSLDRITESFCGLKKWAAGAAVVVPTPTTTTGYTNRKPSIGGCRKQSIDFTKRPSCSRKQSIVSTTTSCSSNNNNRSSGGVGGEQQQRNGRNSVSLIETGTAPPDADRVEAFLSRTQRQPPLSKQSRTPTTTTRTDIWRSPLALAAIFVLCGAIVLLATAAAYTAGYRYGVSSVNLEMSYLQLAQVKFDEALAHFQMNSQAAQPGTYRPEFERTLSEQSRNALRMFDRSTATLGQVAGGSETLQGTRMLLQAELLDKQLHLAGDNALKGIEVSTGEWEYDDRTIDTALDECRCRAVLMNRFARQKFTRADGVVTYSDWADHGQIGQCSWKGAAELQAM